MIQYGYIPSLLTGRTLYQIRQPPPSEMNPHPPINQFFKMQNSLCVIAENSIVGRVSLGGVTIRWKGLHCGQRIATDRTASRLSLSQCCGGIQS